MDRVVRNPNTNVRGGTFSRAEIEAVWHKGRTVPGYDPNRYRKDTCDKWMEWSGYGDVNHDHGWEIDHIQPVARGGDDRLVNLQPLHWRNNRHKGDNWPNWTCAVRSAA